MEETYTVLHIYEDDFGCEERPADQEPQVIVVLQDRAGLQTVLKQPDAWLYQQQINEGSAVRLDNGQLRLSPAPHPRSHP